MTKKRKKRAGKKRKRQGEPTSVWFNADQLRAFDAKRKLVSRSAIIQELVQLWITGKLELGEQPVPS